MSDEVNSPCVRNCCLDDDDICIGCARSVDEIIEWGGATNLRKLEILAGAEKRKNKTAKIKPDYQEDGKLS